MQQYQVFIKLYLLFLIPRSKCDSESFIVNGDVANIRDFPHSAALFITFEDPVTSQHFTGSCGSSIINPKILLTAAHCVEDINSNSTVIARVGNADRKKGTTVCVERTVTHGRYNRYNLVYDIALLRLKKALKFSGSVRSITIVKYPPNFEKAQIAGWGHVDEINSISTNTLYYVDQYVWDRKRCENTNLTWYPGVLCAQSKDTSQYASHGDSGSALVVHGFIQIGIVSYKMKDFDRSVTMYTDTGMLYDWIIHTMTHFLQCPSSN